MSNPNPAAVVATSDPRGIAPACGGCTAAACPFAVARLASGAERFVITMGHPGYNSPANNRDGYTTEEGARAAVARYSRPR